MLDWRADRSVGEEKNLSAGRSIAIFAMFHHIECSSIKQGATYAKTTLSLRDSEKSTTTNWGLFASKAQCDTNNQANCCKYLRSWRRGERQRRQRESQ